jgi:hypothetical protein
MILQGLPQLLKDAHYAQNPSSSGRSSTGTGQLFPNESDAYQLAAIRNAHHLTGQFFCIAR